MNIDFKRLFRIEFLARNYFCIKCDDQLCKFGLTWTSIDGTGYKTLILIHFNFFLLEDEKSLNQESDFNI